MIKKAIVVIERIESFTLEIDLPENLTRLEVTDKIYNNPGDYLEKNLPKITQDNVTFEISKLKFKE